MTFFKYFFAIKFKTEGREGHKKKEQSYFAERYGRANSGASIKDTKARQFGPRPSLLLKLTHEKTRHNI
jgi:hypothetical protein